MAQEPAALGRTLIIANPAAQSGAGRETAEGLRRFLSSQHPDGASFELVYTERPGHAIDLAAGAQGFDSVFALGGDGVVHEVANGLMRIDAAARPALGVVPVGSGNDFARTLGLTDYTGRGFTPCLSCERVAFDVGRIAYRPPAPRTPPAGNGCGSAGAGQGNAAGERERDADRRPSQVEYFVETLSFGLDAAIALGTFDLRARTHMSGATLYALSGANVLLRSFAPYPALASFDGGPAQRIRTFLMAVQLGATYGSGFLICPQADPTDGLFDVCFASGHAGRARALALLLRARSGRHLGSPLIHTVRASRLELAFDDGSYPIQADGERIVADRMLVDILPGALSILRPLGVSPARSPR